MTAHLPFRHQCPDCEAHYIPYSKDIVCPKCGKDEEDKDNYSSFINMVVEGARYHKTSWTPAFQAKASYTPGVFATITLGDSLAFNCWLAFDFMENAEHCTVEEALDSWLDKGTWTEENLWYRNYLKPLILSAWDKLHE